MLHKTKLTILASELHKFLTMKNFRNYLLIGLLSSSLIFTSCGDDDDAPEEENEVEVITDVTLVFTNKADKDDVVKASAKDPDGIGAKELELVDGGNINLTSGVTYTLTFEISNALDSDDVEDIAEEIEEEDDEHQLFFEFTDGAFTSPTGNGNIDKASDPINYKDKDDDGNNVGLKTEWTAGSARSGGKFRVQLQHQPDIKTATTGAKDGDTDFDLTFKLNISSTSN